MFDPNPQSLSDTQMQIDVYKPLYLTNDVSYDNIKKSCPQPIYFDINNEFVVLLATVNKYIHIKSYNCSLLSMYLSRQISIPFH